MEGTESICRIDRGVENVEAPPVSVCWAGVGRPSPVCNRAKNGARFCKLSKSRITPATGADGQGLGVGRRLAGAGRLRRCRRAGFGIL